MKNHPPPHQLEQYFARTLAANLFLRIHRHVTACEVCAERGRARRTVKEDYETLWSAVTAEVEGEPYHVSEATARLYLDDRLDEIDREIADGHLELCEVCAARLARLRKTTESMPLKRAARWPYRSVAALVAVAAIVTAALALFKSQTASSAYSVNADLRLENLSSDEKQSDARTGETVEGMQPLNVIAINDGPWRVTLDEQGQLSGLENLSPELRQAVRAALVSQSLGRPPLLAELRTASGTLRGAARDGQPFKLLAPLGKVIQSDRPEFQWQPLAGAESYRVSVTDAQLNEVAVSPPLTSTRWRMPQALARGAVYSWQVTASKDGQSIISPQMPAPEARFKVLDAARNQELGRARQAYKGSHLALGILYFRYSLMDEAAAEFRALSKENPQSELARKLLRSVESGQRA